MTINRLPNNRFVTYPMECYSAIKSSKLLLQITVQVILKIILLTRRHTKKENIPHNSIYMKTWKTQINKNQKMVAWRSVCWGSSKGWITKGSRKTFKVMDTFIILAAGMGSQVYTCIKTCINCTNCTQ